MRKKTVTGLLMAAVLAISSCQGSFSVTAAEPGLLTDQGELPDFHENTEEISDFPEGMDASSGEETDRPDQDILDLEETDNPDEAGEEADLPEEIIEEAEYPDGFVKDETLQTDLSDAVIEETAEEPADDETGFLEDDEIFCEEEAQIRAEEELEEDHVILVTTEPYLWGAVSRTESGEASEPLNRIEDLPVLEGGRLFGVLKPVPDNKQEGKEGIVFSHWMLNQKELQEGTDCTYEYDAEHEMVGLAAINEELLTGNDILTAVFEKPADEGMVMETFRFRTSEGGVLKAESWSEPYDELICRAAITHREWGQYNSLYGMITAAANKGWRFVRWEDKNGTAISTEATVRDLRKEQQNSQANDDSVFIRNYEDSPFTAVFEELGSLTIKVSAKGAEIPATASFTVTGPEGFEKKLTYNKFTDGEYTLEDLVPGTYTVKEDEASAALDSFELAVSYPENGEALIVKEALKASVSIVNTYTEKTTAGPTGDNKPSEEAALKNLDDQILNIPTEESPDALYGKLYFRVMGVGKHAIKLRWRKINGATGYVLYGGPCKGRFQRLGMVTANRCTVNKLKKGTYYKFKLVAVKQTGKGLGVEMISKVVHEVTAGGKLGNPRGISFSGKKKITLKMGKSIRINAKPELPAGLKLRVHRRLCFESSNPAVATVTRKGKIKAVGRGNATIYVYAQNGICRQVKVRVN